MFVFGFAMYPEEYAMELKFHFAGFAESVQTKRKKHKQKAGFDLNVNWIKI